MWRMVEVSSSSSGQRVSPSTAVRGSPRRWCSRTCSAHQIGWGSMSSPPNRTISPAAMVSARFRARAGPPLGWRAKRSGYRRLRHAASNSEVSSSDPSSTTTTSKGRSSRPLLLERGQNPPQALSPVEGGHHHRNQRRGHLRGFPLAGRAPAEGLADHIGGRGAARPRGIPRLLGHPRSAVGCRGPRPRRPPVR